MMQMIISENVQAK